MVGPGPTAPPCAPPGRGDIVWLSFSPQAGRPGLVLSPRIYNERSGLALVCPITTRRKGYPFEVPLVATPGVDGVVLADHLRSVDWRARRAEHVSAAPAGVVEEVLRKVSALLN